tara:strand:- start:2785 stop:2985 length:201 start_codon:yes stop_codon:yes gene_type:complete
MDFVDTPFLPTTECCGVTYRGEGFCKECGNIFEDAELDDLHQRRYGGEGTRQKAAVPYLTPIPEDI